MFCCIELRQAAIITPKWQKNGYFLWADGCDFAGKDINAANPPKTKKEDCGTTCLNNPNCDYFSWDTSRNCWHKKWTGTGATAKTGARCGYIPGRSWTSDGWTLDGDVTWKDNCDFKGQDLQETTNPSLKTSLQECGKTCYNHIKCDHFTWTAGDKKCVLKSQWDRSNPTSSTNAKCGYVDSYPPLTSWRADVFYDGTTKVVFDWAMACYFDGLYNPKKISNLSFQACKMNCYNDKNCRNLVWTPSAANGKTGDCSKYDGTKVMGNTVVPRIDKRDNVEGTACGFFETRKLSSQPTIPIDNESSTYNP